MLTADERLALIRVKVERAKKHISDLEGELRAFLDSEPYKVGTKPDAQIAESLKYYVIGVTDTPDTILLITGDILFNLRAALDHLAFQLAWVHGTRDEKILKNTYFPISYSADGYKTDSPGKVKGMAKAAQNAIAKTKPYKGGDAVLWPLHRLNNIDKHRFLITAGFHVTSFIPSPILRVGMLKALAVQEGWPVTASDAHLETIKFFMHLPGGKPLKKGDELNIPFDRIPDLPELKKDMKFTFEVAINEPGVVECQPLLPTLVGMADRVDNLILSFKPLLV